jgi:hypothetical protein
MSEADVATEALYQCTECDRRVVCELVKCSVPDCTCEGYMTPLCDECEAPMEMVVQG